MPSPAFRASSPGRVINGSTWVETYTPNSLGSTLVIFCLQNATTADFVSASVTPNDLGITLAHYEPPAGGSVQMSGHSFITTVTTTSLAEHTITINWDASANGPIFIQEYEECQLVSTAAADASGHVNINGSTLPSIHRTDGYDVTPSVIAVAVAHHRRSAGLGFTGMPAPWVRADSGAVAAQYGSFYRLNWSPDGLADRTDNDSRGPNPSGDQRDNVGLYVPIETAGAAGPTQDTPTSIPQQLFGNAGSQDISGDWTTSGGAVTFGNMQGAPTGLTINSAGLISWTAAVAVGTTFPITYDATDSNGTVTSNQFNFVVAANPPSEDTPPPSPLNATVGQTGVLADVSGNYSLGAGGTGPLNFFASSAGTAWPAELTINQTTGEISTTSASTGAAGLQIRVEDSTGDPGAAINDTGTPFEYTVSAGGTLTTPVLKDDSGAAVTGRTAITVAIFPGTTVTATPTLVVTAEVQEADGTIIIGPDPALVIGTKYTVACFEPKSDDAEAYRGIYRLTAT